MASRRTPYASRDIFVVLLLCVPLPIVAFSCAALFHRFLTCWRSAPVRCFADCKSAIQQITNLRYDSGPWMKCRLAKSNDAIRNL
jgi:hypothetical protein